MFGNSTKLYAVYIKPDDDAPHETAEFIEEHFSIWGFAFHGFWCLYHSLWLRGIIVLAIWAILVGGAAKIGLGLASSAAIAFAIRVIVGFDGNSWRGQKLRSKGYILSDIVSGESDLAAKRRFYANWLAVNG